MLILGKDKIIAAYQSHSEWKAALERWVTTVESAKWKFPTDVRQTYNSADPVGQYVVFDIQHNKCRLISVINYQLGTVLVDAVVSHTEYDSMKLK